MKLTNYDQLDAMHLDVLREIGNIGAGNSATSIAMMLGKEVDMTVPIVRVLGYQDVVEFLGGPENVVAGILIRITGDIEGMMMIIFQEDFISNILKKFFGSETTTMFELGEIDVSAITEMGNIMSGAYVNAIATMTNLAIDISVPEMTIDMVGAILSVPAIEYASVSDTLLFIGENFICESEEIKSNIILIPTLDSLSVIMERLGVDHE